MFFYCISLILVTTISLVHGIIVNDGDDLPDLKWPSKYFVEGEKWAISGSRVEDFQYWRQDNISRVDYNNGVVKTFAFKKKKNKKYGIKYNIFPKTTEEVENKMFCTTEVGSRSSRISLDEILPDVDEFIYKDTVSTDKDIHEFFSFSDDDLDTPKEERKVLHAQLKDNETWIPIKLKVQTFNTWLGALTEHVIWYFYNFQTEFDDDVFTVENYCKNPQKVHKKEPVIVSNDNEEYMDSAFESRVLANNRNNTGFKLGINKYSDRTHGELQKLRGLKRNKRTRGTVAFPYSASEIKQISSTLPEEIDLRLFGFISPVEEQEDCGSCWTFGTTSAVEGAVARSNGRLIKLSNQALLDCSWGFDNDGCEGGTDTGAYQWMMKHGLPTEEEYGPYTNKNGLCRIHNMTSLYPIRGYVDVTPYSVESLKVALLNHGPLSVSMDATDKVLSYSGGIYYDTTCEPEKLNHEVTLVGYGQTDGEEYWIIKNSWGRDWGIDGYLHISTRDNSCGITYEPTYPVL
ncbi:unnamed protein product [Leptosia nina]|uniref:Peptidase C1A papain C-terminal domain-containing protein n=1 Tax=Leptosia nina TaxID=320188 RepID=A0AAV1K4L6_9NEOP